jgi:hypothetical protein
MVQVPSNSWVRAQLATSGSFVVESPGGSLEVKVRRLGDWPGIPSAPWYLPRLIFTRLRRLVRRERRWEVLVGWWSVQETASVANDRAAAIEQAVALVRELAVQAATPDRQH